jgi:small multidrug resistance pump
MMHAYWYLGIAIVFEVIATSALRAAEGFTRFVPAVIVVIGYGVSFYCLSMTLKSIPVGMVYAIWSGLGIVLVSIVAYVVYQQKLDLPALIGMGFIIAGVLIINLFSKSAAH